MSMEISILFFVIAGIVAVFAVQQNIAWKKEEKKIKKEIVLEEQVQANREIKIQKVMREREKNELHSKEKSRVDGEIKKMIKRFDEERDKLSDLDRDDKIEQIKLLNNISVIIDTLRQRRTNVKVSQEKRINGSDNSQNSDEVKRWWNAYLDAKGREDYDPSLVLVEKQRFKEELGVIGNTLMSPSQKRNVAFWSQFIERKKVVTVSDTRRNYICILRGDKYEYNYVITPRDEHARVELYFPNNRQLFSKLKNNGIEIEQSFGEKLDWQGSAGERASRATYYIALVNFDSRENWPDVQDKLFNAMSKLKDATIGYVESN